nr:protein CASP-like [Ipomoea batatas]
MAATTILLAVCLVEGPLSRQVASEIGSRAGPKGLECGVFETKPSTRPGKAPSVRHGESAMAETPEVDALDEEAPLEKEEGTPLMDEEAMSWMRRRCRGSGGAAGERGGDAVEGGGDAVDEEAMPWMRGRRRGWKAPGRPSLYKSVRVSKPALHPLPQVCYLYYGCNDSSSSECNEVLVIVSCIECCADDSGQVLMPNYPVTVCTYANDSNVVKYKDTLPRIRTNEQQKQPTVDYNSFHDRQAANTQPSQQRKYVPPHRGGQATRGRRECSQFVPDYSLLGDPPDVPRMFANPPEPPDEAMEDLENASGHVGFSGGIWILWNSSVNVNVLNTHPQFVNLQVDDKRSHHWLLTVVYGSPNMLLRRSYNNASSRNEEVSGRVLHSFWTKGLEFEPRTSGLIEYYLTGIPNRDGSKKRTRRLAEMNKAFLAKLGDSSGSFFTASDKGHNEVVQLITFRSNSGLAIFEKVDQNIGEVPGYSPSLWSSCNNDLGWALIPTCNRSCKRELHIIEGPSTHFENSQKNRRKLAESTRGIAIIMREKVKEIVEIKQRSLAEENQKTLEVLKEREQLLQDQLRQAQESVSNMQKLHELAQSQLFEVRAQSEEEGAAKQSEVNLLMDEVERAQARLLSLEREKGLLRSQLQSANEDNDDGKSDNFDGNSILENSLSAKEKLVSELNAELHNLENTLSNEREQHMSEMKKLNALLHEKDVSLEEMKKELQTRPTAKLVDDLKKKVKILQAVGYNSIEAEDWEAATTGEEMSKLESLLLDKNRKMEHDLTQLKVKLSEKTSMLESAEAKIDELTAKVSEQQRLIQKLEDDILKGYSSREKKSTIFEEWDLSESGGTEKSGDAAQRRSPPDQDQSSMLKVICNQRDRFRARLRETEEEIRQLKEKIGSLTTELEKSKADNVKLYEKIRFIQDYNSERVISRGSKKYAEDLESGFSSDVESKYKKLYEDDINPFAAFSKKEREQRYKELGLREKITLSSGRFLLGNKYARSFAFFYTIGLHILVFTCLYRMSALSHISNVPEDKMVNLPHPQ